MILTILFFTLLGIVAFGLKRPFEGPRLARAAATGAILGALLAYFNVYPGSLRAMLLLLAVALFLSGLRMGPPHARRYEEPLIPRAPAIAIGLGVLLIAASLFPYTGWGADTVDEPLYADLQTRQEKGPAPALTHPEDVRVVPWTLASQLLVRSYQEDASFLDTSDFLLERNTYPDTVNGQFIWVNAPVPQTAKWLLGGQQADKVLYVRNDASNLTPTVIDGVLNVHTDGLFWHDRLQKYARDEGELRYVLQDVALQLDDEYNPYWIAYLARLDLRNQPHMEKLVLVDARTGEEQVVGVDEAPDWVEIVYPERYVYQWADYWGKHREGVLYRWFNAQGLVQPDDVTVRYIRLENHTYWLLPMGQLQSPQLGGYILVDTRTGEATFYDRFDDRLIDYATAYNQLQAIMASGAATQGGGAIRLSISEGYLYPVRMGDGSIRDAYIFPLLEGLAVERFAIIDAADYTTKRVFASTIESALRAFSETTGRAPVPPPEDAQPQLVNVTDGVVSGGRALVNLSGTHHRVTLADLADGQRTDAQREMDELELAIARANRGEAVQLEILVQDGRVVDVTYPGITWGDDAEAA